MSSVTYSHMACAKINLALHVMDQRRDGRHLLDSLVCFANVGDVIKISLFPDSPRLVTLRATGPFADDLCTLQDNLIVRAAFSLASQLSDNNISCSPVDVSLVKNLPVASGIGSGSSNAAVALVLLAKIWGKQGKTDSCKMNLHKIAEQLGADVPMCLDHHPKRTQGIGEKLSSLGLFCSLPLLLINPGVILPTSDVFSTLEKKCNPPIDMAGMENIISIEAAVSMLSLLRNDLHLPAMRLVPDIEDVLAHIIRQPGCLLARMSGSGASCFGIFDSRRHAVEAMTRVREERPDWWIVACETML